MGRIYNYRPSEESRQQIKEGLAEYERRQFQHDYISPGRLVAWAEWVPKKREMSEYEQNRISN